MNLHTPKQHRKAVTSREKIQSIKFQRHFKFDKRKNYTCIVPESYAFMSKVKLEKIDTDTVTVAGREISKEQFMKDFTFVKNITENTKKTLQKYSNN
ncbi:hypothetical protein [Vibrio gallicus]|uniref:hypothetical protein n=1 Tax=Vibrio gallicus TaxID=190897 RepID=UPI0021C451D2|nr:hypothetical protein [Vibrio gallicus]